MVDANKVEELLEKTRRQIKAAKKSYENDIVDYFDYKKGATYNLKAVLEEIEPWLDRIEEYKKYLDVE